MLNIVCIKWGNKFSSAHVNILYRSVKANLKKAHNFVCFTDNPIGLDPGIIARELWPNHFNLKLNYRKLYMYSRDILESFDYNILYFDIDTVVTGNLYKFANLKKNTLYLSPSIGSKKFVYNTSFVRLVDDQFCTAWDQFKINSTQLIYNAKTVDGWTGSDQAIISHLFGGKTHEVNENDGIISLRDHPHLVSNNNLKRGIKIVSFYHNEKYGDMSDHALYEKYPWIIQHWMNYADEYDLEVLKQFQEYKNIPTDRKGKIDYLKKRRALRKKLAHKARNANRLRF